MASAALQDLAGTEARHGLLMHEAVILSLGLTTCMALLVRNSPYHPAFLEVAAITFGLTFVLILLQLNQREWLKARLVLASGCIVLFYNAVARITPALEFERRDSTLYAIDVGLFGITPAQACERFQTPPLTDLCSLGYLSYHAYLLIVFIHALSKPDMYTLRCFGPVLTAFAVGMLGYLLVPAIGPAGEYPEFFSKPLVGGWPTQLNAAIVGSGGSVYDVFPSLHVLIAAVLLRHDWLYCRARFWPMSAIFLLLVFSTIYLRYHYAVDLIAGFLLFVGLTGANCSLSAFGSSGIVGSNLRGEDLEPG